MRIFYQRDSKLKPAARRIPAELAAAIAAARGRVPVRKLPPGKAEGAGELHSWASNRRAGRFGVRRRALTTIHCKACGYDVEMDIDPRHVVLKCWKCGSRKIRIERNKSRAEQHPHHDALARHAERAMQRWTSNLRPIDRAAMRGRSR
jgi:hypothetical protein